MEPKLVIIQQNSPPNKLRRMWICDNYFNVKFLNDNKFTDQLLQVTNLNKNTNDDLID